MLEADTAGSQMVNKVIHKRTDSVRRKINQLHKIIIVHINAIRNPASRPAAISANAQIDIARRLKQRLHIQLFRILLLRSVLLLFLFAYIQYFVIDYQLYEFGSNLKQISLIRQYVQNIYYQTIFRSISLRNYRCRVLDLAHDFLFVLFVRFKCRLLNVIHEILFFIIIENAE